MTYYGAKELARSFRTVRNNTIQIAESRVAPNANRIPISFVRSVTEYETTP